MVLSTLHGKALALLLVLLMLASGAVPLLPPADGAPAAPATPWKGSVRVDDGPNTGRDITSVVIARGADDELYAAWVEDREQGTDCFVAASADGGATWSPDVRANPIANPARPWNDTCDVEADANGHVWATFTDRLPAGWRVKLTRSDNRGQSFRTPSEVYPSGDDTEVQAYPSLARTPQGAVSVLFLRRTPAESRLLISTAADGLNPAQPRQLEPSAPATEQHVRGDIASLPDGTLVVAWGYKSPGHAGIKVGTKAPAATDFTVSTLLELDEAVPRELSPRIAVSEGGIVAIAYSKGDVEGVLHTRSTDRGATFSEPVRAWMDPENATQSDGAMWFDSIGNMHLVLTRQLPTPRVLHTYTADGSTFTPPVEVGADWDTEVDGARGREGNAAIAALDDGTLAVVYTAERNATYGVRASRWANMAPTVDIKVPGNGTFVRGLVTVQGGAADPGGISGLVHVYVKMGALGPIEMPGTTSWSHDFDSTSLPDGPVEVTAWAIDGFRTGGVDAIELHVDNNLPPVLDMALPADGSLHRGTVHLKGVAHDDRGFRQDWKAQWRLGDDNWTDLPPTAMPDNRNATLDSPLDLSQRPNGQYILSVRVTDGEKWSEVWTADIRLENRPDMWMNLSRVGILPAQPKAGEEIQVTAYVENIGATSAPRSGVEFKIGPKALQYIQTSNIPPGGEEPIIFFWNATEGNYSFTITVDPRTYIEEADESNNGITFAIYVTEGEGGDEGLPMGLIAVALVFLVVAVLAAVLLSRRRKRPAEAPPGGEVTATGGPGQHAPPEAAPPPPAGEGDVPAPDGGEGGG